MQMEVYSIHDSASNSYMPPMYFRTRGEAIRSFQMACAQADHMFNKYPEHFRLFFVGSWDDGSCQFESCAPQSVIGAHEFGESSRVLPAGASSQVPPPKSRRASTGSAKLV